MILVMWFGAQLAPMKKHLWLQVKQYRSPVQYQNTAWSLACDDPLYLIFCVIPAEF